MLMKNATSRRVNPKEIVVGSNVRKTIDPNAPENVELKASVATHGILQPLLVSKQRGLIAGNRRLWAAIAAGLESVPVMEIDGPLTEGEFTLLQIVENVHRSDLSGFEKFAACREVLSLNPGWQMQELAANLNLSPATITKLLSPSKCTPEWQEVLKAGKVTIDNCYTASKLPLDQQNGLLALKFSGANREQLEAAVRKPRAAPAVKLSTIRLPLPGGVTVTVKGEEIGGEELVEALTLARDAAIKANKESIDVKTLARVMADKSKAGV